MERRLVRAAAECCELLDIRRLAERNSGAGDEGDIFVTGINDRGELIGESGLTIQGGASYGIGYLIDGSALTTFTEPNIDGISTGAINDSGEFVGTTTVGVFTSNPTETGRI